jgi:tetratricopeptide (TPR) repeat protein
MSSDIERWEPPNDSTAFESLCLDLWKDIWQDSNAQKNGRRGQRQDGVDLFGHENGLVAGVQCKQKDGRLWAKVTPDELAEEVKAAQRFTPKLASFILATTATRDTAVQQRANQLTEQHRKAGLFTVAVWAWEDIWHELYRRKTLFERIAPIYWPRHFGAAFTSPFNSLYQLTPPVSDFTGREGKLDELRKKVKQRGVVITGVRGMGGAGKTELARRLAAELKADYPDAQLELDLKGVNPQPLSPADVLSAILRVFHPTAQLPERPEELAALLRQTLDGHRALLVLDNAKDARQIAPLLPPPPGCLVLVTSRQHFALPGLDAVDLGVMEPPEARALLLKIAPRIGPEVDALAAACGRLPLALRLAASFLAVNRHVTPADYVRQLRDSRQRFQLLDKAQELTDEDLGLETSFTLSFQQLPPEQRQRFTQIAAFPESFDREAVAAVWAVEKSAASDALDVLFQLSLLEWNPQTQRFELHDLLREFARNHAKPEELDAAKLRHAEHFIRLAENSAALFEKGGQNVLAGLALFDRERAHLEAAFEWLESRREMGTGALLVSLVYAVASSGDLRFHPRQRIRWAQAQLEAARVLGNRQAQGAALGHLGLGWADLGQPRRAVEFYERCLSLHREVGDRWGEAATLGNLGSAYADLGETRKAIEFYDLNLAVSREVGDRGGEGAALGNLGIAYFALGHLHEAIEYTEKALLIAHQVGDQRAISSALGNLGIAHFTMGDTRRSMQFYDQQLVLARGIGDRHAEGNALANLGMVYRQLGDPKKALEHCEMALNLAREAGDTRGEEQTLGNVGNCYAVMGDLPRAFQCYEQQLVFARQIADPQGEAHALFNSALVMRLSGDKLHAVARAEAALRIYETLEDPPATTKVRARLAEWRKAEADSQGGPGSG